MHASVKNTLLATAGAAAALAGSSVVASADSITVKSGDTLYALAAANHVSVDDLVSANKIADANLIHVGQKIELSGSSAAQSAAPAKQETKQVSNNGSYTVKAGDSLWAIANANGMTLSELLNANPDLQASSVIYVGDQINLSKSAVKSTATVKPAASQADTIVAQSAAASSAAASEANAKAAAAQSAATSEANAKAVAASSAAVAAENAKTVAAQSAATSEANAKAAAAQSAAASEANAKAVAQSAATSEANAKAAAQSAAAQSAATSEANAKAAAQSAAAQSAATSEANAKAAAQSAAAQSAATSEANAKAAAQSAAAASQAAASQAAASQAAASQAAASQAAASQATAQPQHVAATASATAAKPTSVASANIAGNTYPYGQCTWYVKGDLSWVGNNWGNASAWASSATAAGHTVNGTASVGAVAYFAPGVGGAGGYGHVAVVDSVNSDGTVTISEANYAGKLYNSRTISTSNVSGFIHQ